MPSQKQNKKDKILQYQEQGSLFIMNQLPLYSDNLPCEVSPVPHILMGKIQKLPSRFLQSESPAVGPGTRTYLMKQPNMVLPISHAQELKLQWRNTCLKDFKLQLLQ
jgi:hypothetical protein